MAEGQIIIDRCDYLVGHYIPWTLYGCEIRSVYRCLLYTSGTFSIGEEGQTIFTPGDSGVFNADSYGLSSFHFPVLRSLEEEREEVALLAGKKKKDVFYIPVSRKLIRVVAASAADVYKRQV